MAKKQLAKKTKEPKKTPKQKQEASTPKKTSRSSQQLQTPKQQASVVSTPKQPAQSQTQKQLWQPQPRQFTQAQFPKRPAQAFNPKPSSFQALKQKQFEQQPKILPTLFPKPAHSLKQALAPQPKVETSEQPLTRPPQPLDFKQKLLTALILFCLLGVAFFALSFATQFFQQQDPASQTQASQQQATKYSQPITSLNTPQANVLSCLASRSIQQTEIIEIYSPTCPRSQAMQPIIKSLETQGLKFKKLDITDVQSQATMSECLSQLISGYTPQFICAKKNTQLTGQVSQEQLKQFASECKQP